MSTPHILSPEQRATMNGLQQMRAMIRGELDGPRISKTLDFKLIEATEGRAVFEGVPQQMHLNPMGGVHGGWYATLLDSAMGCAVHTTMPPGRGYTTAELSVNLVRAARLDGKALKAIGTVLHVGRQLATAEGRIVDTDGKLYAHGTTTCLVFELKL
jgi:uncharacterized protein (TIGR00369 family)